MGWAWGGAKECEGYKVGKGVGVCVHFRTKEQGGVWVEVIGGVRECERPGGEAGVEGGRKGRGGGKTGGGKKTGGGGGALTGDWSEDWGDINLVS